jgi:hypothetical protein
VLPTQHPVGNLARMAKTSSEKRWLNGDANNQNGFRRVFGTPDAVYGNLPAKLRRGVSPSSRRCAKPKAVVRNQKLRRRTRVNVAANSGPSASRPSLRTRQSGINHVSTGHLACRGLRFRRWCSLYRWSKGTAKEKALLAAWPLARRPGWLDHVNAPQTESELSPLRRCVKRGCPFGEAFWSDRIVRQLGLESTLRPQGRPKKQKNGSCTFSSLGPFSPYYVGVVDLRAQPMVSGRAENSNVAPSL